MYVDVRAMHAERERYCGYGQINTSSEISITVNLHIIM